MQSEGSGQRIAYDYAKFPRNFTSYRWFKPLLVALLAFVFYLVMVFALVAVVCIWTGDPNYPSTIAEGYDGMDVYTGPGALFELGTIALVLPALALAGLVVRDRPFSSYSTSRGGWNWKTFGWCLLVAFVIMAIDLVIECMLFPTDEGDRIVRFTAVGTVLCIVLVPLQCIAEEYVFRGFILQTVGAWTRLPAVAIVVSAVAFAAGHPYNLYGVIAVLLNGIIWGFISWKSKGLEASCALHIVNNLLAFFTAGIGLSVTTSEVSVESLIVAVVIDVVYAVAVLVLGKKFGWFEPTGDGVAKFNAKRQAKMARRQLPQAYGAPPAPPLGIDSRA